MATRSTRQRAKKTAPTRAGFRITVDGEPYIYDPDDVSWEHEAELYQAVKLTKNDIGAAFANKSFAPFLIAGLVFLGRRADGDAVTYKQVADAITYDSEIEIEILAEVDAIETTALPEGQAAD
jgi:hypothetical protein